MSKESKAIAKNDWQQDEAGRQAILILEKQLMDALELRWHVQQMHVRLNGEANMRIHSLFEGLANELGVFNAMIRNRLDSLRREAPQAVEMSLSSYWRLFSADSLDHRDQLEALLYGYARYARQTSEAVATLDLLGDYESSELLSRVFRAADRCLWFLEIYLEGLALKIASSRLPEWPASGRQRS